MSNGEDLGDKILVYYKIIIPGVLKSSFDSDREHLCSAHNGLSYNEPDSSHSDFMCTVVSSKNPLCVSDVLLHLNHVLYPSKSVMFTKILASLDSLYPYPVSLDSMPKVSRSAPGHFCRGYIDRFDDTPNVLGDLDNRFNRNNSNLEKNLMGFDISNLSKNFKIDNLVSKLSSLRGVEERRKSHFVWVCANLDEPVHTIDNKIYIKLYLSNVPGTCSRSNITGTSGFLYTIPKCDDMDTISDSFKPNLKTDVLANKPLSASGLFTLLIFLDRDEIYEMINSWSLTSDGKLKDIRSLLSTLQNVLEDDVSWEPMPISLLVGSKDSIKKYYKRALLTFHPDKLISKSDRNKFRSELIIQTLIRSWNCSM